VDAHRLGHEAGDRLLVGVAARLESALRDADTIGRMGGDEFVVLIDGASLEVAPEVVADRLLEVMRQPFVLPGAAMPLIVNTSIGIAVGDRATPGRSQDRRRRLRHRVLLPRLAPTVPRRLPEDRPQLRRRDRHVPRVERPHRHLFRNVARALWFLTRRLRGAGLDLVWAGTDKSIRARRGQPTVRLRGLPGELLLFLFGRRDAADVEITGSPEAIEALQRTPFGM